MGEFALVLIYLDTRDLITLTDAMSYERQMQFAEGLRRVGAKLVFSMTNITEVSAPLLHGGPNTNVMQRLNLLETMPHQYIAEAAIESREFHEARAAFHAGREYSPITLPIVPRFDYVVSPFRDPPTKRYLSYGLAQAVFELWTVDAQTMAGYETHARKLRALLKVDRLRKDYKRHASNFAAAVERNLRLYQIPFSVEWVVDFAHWIRTETDRCPAVQLGYEVFHAILRNVGDESEDSDIPDFSHISCVAYVDLATLDNRMRDYVRRADNSRGTHYSDKLCRDLADLELRIGELPVENNTSA